MIEAIAQVLATIGAVVGFTEWRFKVLHACMHRIENRLDNHMEKLSKK